LKELIWIQRSLGESLIVLTLWKNHWALDVELLLHLVVDSLQLTNLGVLEQRLLVLKVCIYLVVDGEVVVL
jgi:hypothetical protein